MIHIGFTGTQVGMTQPQADTIAELVMQVHGKDDMFTAHHGDCIGADHDFHRIVRLTGGQVHLHPPDNPDKRAFCDWNQRSAEIPYLERNHEIVHSSQYMLATPSGYDEIQRSGTWATIRYSRKQLELGQLKSLVIVWPDGSKKVEA